jgi:YHS domain-containing protein
VSFDFFFPSFKERFMAFKLSLLSLVGAALLAGCNNMQHGNHMMGGHQHAAPTAAEIAAAKDVGNTKCVVTGDDVGTSKAVAIHDGKLYHFCCADCAGKFHADPQKYVKMVEADPAKYGIKK